jgi:hypothetical protein
MQQKLNEKPLVTYSDTVIDPRTVVVHPERASATCAAVMRPLHFEILACFAPGLASDCVIA